MTDTSFAHLPERTDHQERDPSDPARLPGVCFECFCYQCGGRTDQPRLVEKGGPILPGLHRPYSHAWCFADTADLDCNFDDESDPLPRQPWDIEYLETT